MPQRFEINVRPAARADLQAIYDWIAERGGPSVAVDFVRRIQRSYQSLASFPERGTRRDYLYPGLRTFGMGRRVTIAFRIRGHEVIVMRILYGGRDLDAALDEEPESGD